jgi:hypothetical protein
VQYLHEARGAVLLVHDLVDRDAVDPRGAVVLAHLLPCLPQHVLPIDPVVQRIEPELRLSLGLEVQLPPQLREFLRQSSALAPFGDEIRVHRRVFRSRDLGSQAALHSSCVCMHPAGPLGSTVVTRFTATMSPADSRRSDPRLMPSPRALGSTQTTGSPRLLTNPSARADPNHPGRSNGCVRPLLRHRLQASSSWEAWPPASVRHEAESGSLHFGSRLRLPRLHAASYPAPRARSATC